MGLVPKPSAKDRHCKGFQCAALLLYTLRTCRIGQFVPTRNMDDTTMHRAASQDSTDIRSPRLTETFPSVANEGSPSLAEHASTTKPLTFPKPTHSRADNWKIVLCRRTRFSKFCKVDVHPEDYSKRNNLPRCRPSLVDPLPSTPLSDCDTCDADSNLHRQKDSLPDRVDVIVEATALCDQDLHIRRNASEIHKWWPCAFGSSFVGRVQACGPEAKEAGIKPGSRVAVIAKSGPIARYVPARAQDLVTVPKELDAADIACLIATYLPAFQALHHGRIRPYRYSRTCFKGRRILVTGGASPEGLAVVRLAQLAGAKDIFVTAPRAHFDVIKAQRAIPVEDNAEAWLDQLEGRIDIAIDLNFPRNFVFVRQSLARKGRLVCRPIHHCSSAPEQHCMTMTKNLFGRFRLCMMKRATIFDFTENLELYRNETEQDFGFLLRMLALRKIRPHIDRFIRLGDVPEALLDLRAKLSTGTIICEPWK